MFAAGPFVNYQAARAFSLAVSSVRGASQRMAEAISLAKRSGIAVIHADLHSVLAGDVFVYHGTVWNGISPEQRATLLSASEEAP